MNTTQDMTSEQFHSSSVASKKEYWSKSIRSLLPHLIRFENFEAIEKFNELFRNHSSLKNSDFLFFEEYLNDLTTSNKEYIKASLYWFIEQSNSSWLLDNNSLINTIIPLILPKEGDRVTKFNAPCFNALGLKLNKLTFEEFEQFYYHISSCFNSFQKKSLLIFLTPTLNDTYFDYFYKNFEIFLESNDKILIGKSFCNDRIFDLNFTYLDIITFYLHEHISHKNTGIDFGRNFTLNKLHLYVELYEKLDPQYRHEFINNALYQYFLKVDSGKILNELFLIREKNLTLIDFNIIVLLTWRVMHIFPADKKNEFFNTIIQHVSQTGELEWLKNSIFKPNTIKIAGTTIDTSNIEFQKQLKIQTYHILSNELATNIVKPKTIKL